MTNSCRRFTDDDLVRDLNEAWVLDIGNALNSDLPENWIALATRLGLKNEEIESLRHVANPGYDAVRIWRRGPNTTIRVLRNALTQMKRFDVIDRLEKAITDPTDVTIVIRFNNEVHHLTEGGVPGLTTLLDFVRPHIYCKFSHMLAKGMTCAHLSPGANRYWTSTVAEFRGQQIDITLSPVRQQRSKVKSEVELRQRQHIHVERNCQSYMENELLVFEVGTTAPSLTTETPHPSPRPLGLPSIDFAPQGLVLHPESDNFPSSPGCQFQAEEETYRTLPGFHPEILPDDTRRRMAADVLERHLEKNGAYILRRTNQENSVLALSVVDQRKVSHFSIMRNVTGASCNYFVFNAKSFSSVSELIAFYHHNSLSTEYTLLLTTPVY